VLGGEPVGLAGYTVTHSEAVLLHITTAQTQPAFECGCPVSIDLGCDDVNVVIQQPAGRLPGTGSLGTGRLAFQSSAPPTGAARARPT
jgi:hypothetical protein